MAPRTRLGIKRKQEAFENNILDTLSILSQNGWISARDLCRLEATTTTVNEWVKSNDAWKTLCCSRFPNTLDIPKRFIRRLGGYKMLFRRRVSSLVEPRSSRKLPPLPPPSITEEDIMLLLDITVAGKSALSCTLGGEILFALLRTGSVTGTLTRPYAVGKASCFCREEGEACTCGQCRFNSFQYDARIHLMRSIDDTVTSCCIYQPGEKEWSYSMKAETIGNGKYDWKNGEDEWINCFETFCSSDFIDGGLVLQATPQANEIEHRLKGNICFKLEICLSVVEPGDKIAVSAYQIDTMYRAYGEDDWVEFEGAYQKEMGVSLLHILEQVQGIEESDPPKGSHDYVNVEDSMAALE